MKFRIDSKEKYTLVKSELEKLDAQHAPDLKSELVYLNKNGVKNIIIDLTGTRYCDSSGLSAILVANRLCKGEDGTFILTGLEPAVAKLVSISQLDTVLNITPTLNEAQDLLFMEQVEKDLDED
ncbi:MAG: STAS domain-containing protein [Flavobacteriales bacterium]|nr:STAS domain-containing protein [Flavobacteriales bacterium]